MLYLTNYSEAQNSAIEDSFKTQFRDLRLQDFTDGFIEAQFRSSLPASFTVSNPYIFKFTKDLASFIYLGTFHILPLDVLPENLINMILLKDNLFIEAFAEEAPEEDVFIQDNQPALLVASEEPQDWFLNLPIKFQQFLDVTLSNAGLPNCYLYPLEAIQDKLSYIHLQGYKDFMDRDVVYSKDWYSMDALEDSIKNINTDDLSNSALEDGLIQILNSLSGAVKYSGTYFSGTHGLKDLTEIVDDPYMQERNLKWAKKIKEVIEEDEYLSDELVIAAGYDHLFHENGLLQLFAQDEWTIERVDLTGNWHEIEITADGYIA